MDYLTVKEIALKWSIGSRMVSHYCEQGRVPGAVLKGNLWPIPQDATKPVDGRSLRYQEQPKPLRKERT